MRIDTSGWAEFCISDIFHMRNTKSITQKSIIPDSGETPYVTAQFGNNAVSTYIDCPTEWLEDGNCILIGGKTLAFSYQKQPFCSNDSHNIALYLRNGSTSETVHLYLISVLQRSLSQKYSWGDSISMKSIQDDTLRLPVDASGEPDCAYMDEYMSRVLANRGNALDDLKSVIGGEPS